MKGFDSPLVCRAIRALLTLCAAGLAGGCFSLPQNPAYRGPAPRPPELESYYSRDGIPILSVTEELQRRDDAYEVRRLVLETGAGRAVVDYYRRDDAGDELILLFPVLGGKKNIPENYFASYFAERGFDTAVIHRDEDIKKPENFLRFEELMRANLVRDRLVMDHFEERYGKRRFGAFGISRGAINVATTAGIDERLAHSVMLLGGSDLVGMFKHTDQRRIRFLVDKLSADRKLTPGELYEELRTKLKSDPKFVARHVDSRNTLLFLGLFDQTVPVKYGFRLRALLGDPETIVLLSGHYTSVLYTHLPTVLPAGEALSVLPNDYVEAESLRFFRHAFETRKATPMLVPFRLLRLPFDIVGRAVSYFWLDRDAVPEVPEIPWREEGSD